MQAIAPVTTAELRHPVQRLRYKLEVWDGSAWVDLYNVGGRCFVKSISISLGGAGMTPDPIAGEWSATIDNELGLFHPYHPVSGYASLLRIGREVRISVGGNYGGVDTYWQRLIGFMDAPRFDHGSRTVEIGGRDYMKLLRDTILGEESPIVESGSGSGSEEVGDIIQGPLHWGRRLCVDSQPSSGATGAECYTDADAVSDDDADTMANWSATLNTTVGSTPSGPNFIGSFQCDAAGGYGINPTAGTLEVAKQYVYTFRYRRTAGNGFAYILLEQLSGGPWTILVDTGLLSEAAWTTVTVKFTAIASAAYRVSVYFTDPAWGSGDITTFQFDDFSVKLYDPVWYRYPLPDDCNGPYFVTLDGDPVWQGERDKDGHFDGWLYDETTRYFCFDEDKFVEAGEDNLCIYYHTTQTIENVVADLMVYAGLYADRAAALADMDYTATGTTIDRVWFEPTQSALDAVTMLCERVNYRFWFAYDGKPCFQPAPTAGATDFSFTSMGDLHAAADFQDIEEVRNRITIEGSERAMFQMVREDKTNNRWKGEASDATSIALYLEKTYEVTNNLFQSQASVDAMCLDLLAAFKDPKWYAELELAFNPVPLELGDTITWAIEFGPVSWLDGGGFLPPLPAGSLDAGSFGESLSNTVDGGPFVGGDFTFTGIIRDIKINDGIFTYKIEISDEVPSASESASASASGSASP